MTSKFELTVELGAESARQIYEIVKREYLIEDFKERLSDVLEEDEDITFTDEEFEIMATEFFLNHDCNIADNDQYHEILKKAIKRKRGE